MAQSLVPRRKTNTPKDKPLQEAQELDRIDEEWEEDEDYELEPYSPAGYEWKAFDFDRERRSTVETIELEPLNSSIHSEVIWMTRPARIWARVKSIFTSPAFIVFLYWFLSIAGFFLVLSALFINEWRKIVVDRDALVNLWNKGKIHLSLLNETIAYTRTQGIYKECFVASNGKQVTFLTAGHEI